MKRLLSMLLILLLPFAHAESLYSGAVFSPLDEFGRAGEVLAILSPETLEGAGERGSISEFIPTGFVKVDIAGHTLWERCHLLGAQLASNTERTENLVTGTPQMNRDMLNVENEVTAYIQATGEHVIYRVTPNFYQNNLVCNGVRINVYSVESSGLRKSVFCRNIQDGVTIDYFTGFAGLEGQFVPPEHDAATDQHYILNVKSRRFHKPSCSGAADIKQKNRQEYDGDRETLIQQGYKPCGTCNP